VKLHTFAFIGLMAATVPLAACQNGVSTTCDQACTVTKAYATAESSVTIAAKGVSKAVDLGAIKPGSDTAKAVKLALDGASKALDVANAYINAGNYGAAQTQIDNANKTVADVNAQTGVQ
jgi:hypothetical protein